MVVNVYFIYLVINILLLWTKAFFVDSNKIILLNAESI